MTREEICKGVLDIVQSVAPDEDLSKLKPNVRFRDQMELDSMGFLDMIMELYKRYSVTIPEGDYLKLATLDSCVAYLEPILKDR